MLKRANISWNARQLSKMITKGTITFDNAVQRGLVWDNDRKSLLIHSMIEGYPIPPMYAAKDSNKNYSMLDGKQRCNCINDFLNGKFTLQNVPEITLEDGTEVDINGKFFSGLDEDIQDIISNYSLTIYYFEDISDDEVSELFYRLNNGRALSSVELSRSRAKSLRTIQQIGQHELFTTALTAKAFEKYTHEDLVIKSYIMLTSDTPCLDTKFVRPIMINAEFTDDDIKLMNSVYDRILNTYKTIISDDSVETGKISKRIAKRLITRTHMLSIMPIVKQSIDNGVSDETFVYWIKNFFCGTKSATKYDSYNSRCTSGSGHAENIRVRLETIQKDYDVFMNHRNKNKNEVEVIKDIEVVEDVKEVQTEVTTDIVQTSPEAFDTDVNESVEEVTSDVVEAKEEVDMTSKTEADEVEVVEDVSNSVA